jgi:multidrug efflux pump subunit AcrA (membrane-fusion protein)
MTTSRRHGAAALLLAAGLALAGCGATAQGAEEAAPPEVATVDAPQDGGPATITLDPRAEQRLGITTTAASARGSDLVIPYAAVVYDADGSSWAFVRTGPSTYQREAIAISRIDGDQVTLTSGPQPGTEVVTVGAAELVGVETGIDGEE